MISFDNSYRHFHICVKFSAVCLTNSRKCLILTFWIIFFFLYIFIFVCLESFKRIALFTSAIAFWIFEIHFEFLLSKSENDFLSETEFLTNCWMNAFRYFVYQSIFRWELSVFDVYKCSLLAHIFSVFIMFHVFVYLIIFFVIFMSIVILMSLWSKFEFISFHISHSFIFLYMFLLAAIRLMKLFLSQFSYMIVFFELRIRMFRADKWFKSVWNKL